MRLFITGTDTDVGKTAATAALAAALAERGTVVAAKPVASGVPDGQSGDDAEALGRAAGHPPTIHTTYRAPLSPHRAARQEGRPLDERGLLAWVEALSADHVLVEGVGGWCVPLSDRLWVRDLARAAADDVVVVAADRIGVLNHTLLTVEAVRRDGFRVLGVVLNRGIPTAEGDPSPSTNADDLRMLLDVPVVVLERFEEAGAAREGRRLLGAISVIRSSARSGEA